MEPIVTKLGTEIYKNSSAKRIVLGKKHPLREQMAIKQIYTDKANNFFKIHLRADESSINCCDIKGNIKDFKEVLAWIKGISKSLKSNSKAVFDSVCFGDGLDENLSKRLSRIAIRK